MSQQATSDLYSFLSIVPDLASFLGFELTPAEPSDLNDICGICIRPWNEDATSIVSLPCHHLFHHGCIELWLTEGAEKVATCPICRRKLCIRLDPEGDGHFSIPMEHFENPKNHWEDMSVSRDSLSELLPTIHLAVNTIWQELVDEANSELWTSLLVERAIVFDDLEENSGPDWQHYSGEGETEGHNGRNNMVEENEVDEVRPTGRHWAYLIMHALKRFRSMDRTGLAEPCGSMEFLVLVVTMQLLWHRATEANLNTTALVVKMDTFTDFEEHADTRTIFEAYQAVGLGTLIIEAGLVSRLSDLTVW
ncbi:hypothetical protein HBI17_106720 [Parastagonospora nodorum]|nr:hypothetical protein HBH52_149370 [Parastagonospora nodorum]KAH4188646.1 hypothetical protein HBH42_148620 [Parastagonospora nodorum]KAH4968451.1 hypothetical protein HBI78_069230 [Parastagonospora nodorum]KAH5100245.1 hypothetical protein HBH72_104980 [Parastagonospora nodorum]KAH5124975.1 hypothetical protein HBH71_000710 [Parastagonospora nodorum]